MPRTSSRYCIAAALLAVAAPAADGQRRDRDDGETRIDTTVAFSRTGTVELQLYAGEIIVSSWSRDQVRVRATSERGALRFDATPTNLSLGLRSGAPRSGEVQLEVTVPVGARVRASSSSGDIRISGSRGEVEARTQRGDIVVEDAARAEITALSGDVSASAISGDLRVNVISGDVRVRGVGGDVDVKTVSGEIGLRDSRSRYVRANSTSGDITFDGTVDAGGRYDLQTHSGDVDLTLPVGVGAILTVSTYSGGIESDFPLVLQPGQTGAHGKTFTFTLGRGGGRIATESFSGDINIRSRGGLPPRDGSPARDGDER